MTRITLQELQRDFCGALRMPLRGSSRRATELPPNSDPHHPAFLDAANRLIRPSPTLQPAECLELYHRQVWFRLLDSIAEDFPGLIRLLGRDRFWRVVEAYLLAHPSTSYTLRHLGQHLAGFLPQVIADPVTLRRAEAVVELEWTIMDVFTAPDAPVATPEQVARGSFTLHPHVRLLNLSANASGWLAHNAARWRDNQGRRVPSAVWRTQQGLVRHAHLKPGAFAMLARLAAAPSTLSTWLEDSAADLPGPRALTRWFAEWQQRGWFTPVEKQPTEPGVNA